MMFAPKYTVWHCGYLKGEQEMSNAETSAVYAQEIMRLERENAAMTAERDKCSTGWDTALDITAKYLKRAEEAEAENATLRGLLGRAAVAVEWGINDEYDHCAKGAAAVLLQEINAALKEEGK